MGRFGAAAVLGLGFALALAGCAGEDAGVSVDLSASVDPPAPTPVAPRSVTGCALDSDCAAGRFCYQGACARQCGEDIPCPADTVCSPRGRCVPPGPATDGAATASPDGTAAPSAAVEDDPIDVAAGVTLVARPARVQQVPPGAATVAVVVETSAAPPDGALTWRAERTDDAGDPSRVHTAAGTTGFTLAIEAGAASPDAEAPRAVEVYVITAAGGFRLSLIPQLPVAGTYAGHAQIDIFGGTGLPIDLQVVTDPPAASLEEADAAWVVLPVGREKLFSPHEPLAADDAEPFVTRPLAADAFTGRWVATFVNEYRLPETSMLAAAGVPGQVRRTIRLELEPGGEAGTLVGAISDRWTGLHDHRPDYGERVPANVVFEGTLDLRRVGAAPPYQDVTPPVELGEGDPRALPLPALDACRDEHLLRLAEEPPEGTPPCGALATVADFERASSSEQVACAVAAARGALASETTALEIRAFLEDTNTGDLSFAEFMERCAAGTDGTCRPDDAVLCARQMVAHAYARLEGPVPGADELVTAYVETTREAFLGRQLAAFHTDAQTRMAWLESSDFPAIVTSAVENLVATLLDDWATKVLDVHLAVLSGQFDAAGLTILSQDAASEDEAAERKRLLMEMSQSWRASADALELAATRWNQLFRDDESRADRAAFVSRRMFDLYLTAGILARLNLANGADFASGTFAGGFARVMDALGELVLPFDRLVYARDAEIVVSTSVDPQSDNGTLLRERRDAAMERIDAAAEAVGGIIAEAQAEALDQELLTNRMNNEINDLRSTLVELCGLPAGCTVTSFRTDPTCRVRVAPGQCGFLIDHETDAYLAFEEGAQSVSEAGARLLDVRDAILDYQRAEEEVRAHAVRVNLELETTTAFARHVEEAHATRQQLIADVAAAIRVRDVAREGELGALLANIEARQERRATELQAWGEAVAEWDRVLVDGVESDFETLTAATALESTAMGFRDMADAVEDFGELTVQGFPTCVGTSNDPSAPARLAVGIAAYIASTSLRHGATAMEITAGTLELEVEKERALREARLTQFELHGDLDAAVLDADLARLQELAELEQRRSELEERRLRELVDALERVAEAELAHQADMMELADRQARLQKLLVDAAGLELRRLQADLGITKAVQSYRQVAQRAGLQAARIEDLERQRAEVNSLVGSPAAVFAWANRLELAEQHLIRAKDALMDWLVALEYLAVRPFLDQRVQILLARNTYQLEEIAHEIERLQSVCGGAVSRHVAELSLRDDLLGLSQPLEDPVTGAVSSPAERLRALLARGHVPIDKRVRYTGDSTVGDLLTSRDVLAATVTVSLDHFANLAASCNAKAYALSVQLVGEGLGDARPTVTVLYDGASKLRSCQPGLEDYLDAIGRESTSFGAITRLHTTGRAVSPVAGLNAFPEDGAGNLSLAGLPLASEYTILIDPAIGENGAVDWSRLEDVRLRLEYTYQDFFPEGQCQ